MGRWGQVAVMVVVSSGCSQQPLSAEGELYIAGKQSFDLGGVPLNRTATANALIGTWFSAWTITGARSSGTPVQYLPFLADAAPLRVVPEREDGWVTRRIFKLEVTVDPDAVTVETPLESTLDLTLVRDGTADRATLSFTFKALALPFSCDAPPTVDFGRVAVGAQRAVTIALENPRDVEDVVSAELVATPGFTVTSSGAELVAPHGVREVTVTFAPGSTGVFSTSLQVQRSSVCPAVALTLTGESP
jgi:hypothetical protein